jgi:hypothetical protein
MNRSRRSGTGIAIAIATLAALLLSGCGGAGATPTPAPTPDTARPTPTAVPVPSIVAIDPLETVVALVIRPEALELRDANGDLVRELAYTGDAQEAIATLNTVVGTEPETEAYRGTNHRPPGVYHSWGDLVLDERQYDPDMRAEKGLVGSIVWPAFAIYFDGPATADVTLSTASGLQAGADWGTVEADSGYDGDIWTCNGTAAVEVIDIVDPSRGETRATVIVRATEDDAAALWLGAPELEAGGCA